MNFSLLKLLTSEILSNHGFHDGGLIFDENGKERSATVR